MSSEGHRIYLVRFGEKRLLGLGWAPPKPFGSLQKCQEILRGLVGQIMFNSQQLDFLPQASPNVTFRSSVTSTRKYTDSAKANGKQERFAMAENRKTYHGHPWPLRFIQPKIHQFLIPSGKLR